jgi:hypothetical protein
MPRLPRQGSFTSTLRGPEVAARVGTALGACFVVAFLTGVWSHLYQDQPGWLTIPTRPVWLYRVTQGVHYLSGTAAVPLLLVKLYAVYPRLFAPVPWRRARQLGLHLLERGSIALLVAAAIFQLVTGVADSAQFYPWSFSFRSVHYSLAWVAVGSLLVHVAVKLAVIRSAYARPLEDGGHPGAGSPAGDWSGRRSARRRSRSSRWPAARCPGCAGSRSSRPMTARARRASRSTSRPGAPA